MTPKHITSTACFNRKTLRKITLSLFDNDVFQLTTKILDRDTLVVTTLVSHYTKSSLQAVVSMYLQTFMPVEDMVFDDWLPKGEEK